jgi:polysaccharide biosynthesis protein PslH
VDDMRPYVDRAACFVVPLRVGGGTRLKVLDAWALGRAVVSTTVGCEGLDARNGDNILIADGAAEFANAVVAVLTDASLRTRLEQHGRTTAVASYDWDIIGETQATLYARVISRGQ